MKYLSNSFSVPATTELRAGRPRRLGVGSTDSTDSICSSVPLLHQTCTHTLSNSIRVNLNTIYKGTYFWEMLELSESRAAVAAAAARCLGDE